MRLIRGDDILNLEESQSDSDGVETYRHLVGGMIYEPELRLLTVQRHRDALLSVLIISIQYSHSLHSRRSQSYLERRRKC